MDEAGRTPDWYAGYQAGMRDCDKRQSVARRAALVEAAVELLAHYDADHIDTPSLCVMSGHITDLRVATRTLIEEARNG
jgi:hypothetical protein